MRRSLTPKQRKAMWDAQNGNCAVCGAHTSLSRMIAEHTLPVALGNGEKPDSLLCCPCAKNKTSADIAMISKANRQRKAHLGLKRRRGRPIPKHVSPWPPRGSRKLQSRKFGT